MRLRKSTSWCLGAGMLILAAALGPPATASTAAAVVVTSESVLAPGGETGRVTIGRTAFYSAKWTNGGHATLTNVVVVITLPPGSAASPVPPGCTNTPDPHVVSCPQANLAAGAAVTQQLLVQMSLAAAAPACPAPTCVKAVLTADEKANDQDKSHPDTFPAPDRAVTVVSDTADDAGGCLPDSGAALATGTRDGLSAANPLITSAALTGPSGVLCVPVTLHERPPASPADACGQGATCTTDVAVTEFFPVTQPSSPVQLTFTVLANNKNLTWYKTDSHGSNPVADCPGATNLPTDVKACVTSRSKTGSSTVRLGVLWQAGPDPSWRG